MRAQGPVKDEDGLLAAKLCATPGVCLFCDDPLPKPDRLLCGDPTCEAAYKRTGKRDAAVTAGVVSRPRLVLGGLCAQGHELTPENVRVQRLSDGRTERACLECRRSRDRRAA